MEYLVTAAEMKEYDANTIQEIGIPGMVLMERAALEAFRVIEEHVGRSGEGKRAFILAGMGNNGGDGLVLARLLCEAGYIVDVQCIGNPEHATAQWKMQKKILEHFPVSFSGKNNGAEYNVCVDALFGVGLSRNIEGEYAQAIESFNHSKGFKLSLDIPSGIHSDTGEVMGCAVFADVTVTFGFFKRGLMFFEGKEYAGEVIKAEIGITPRSFWGNPPGMFFYNEEPRSLLPKRDEGGNKGTFGKVLLVAGSMKMAGAAILAAKAAYRIGAGMVKLISPEENRIILQSAVPEALYGTYEDLAEGMNWADVIAIGPGIGKSQDALKCLERVIRESALPLVIDADALNLLAENIELERELAKEGQKGRDVILTPHVGELSRLLQIPISELKRQLSGYGKELAAKLKAVVVAKDARTFICGNAGPICVNVCGNSGMATAGSGDVLVGIIAGLLGQGMEPFEAAGKAVYLHARAGDRAAEELGEHACMAGDLPEFLTF